MDRAEINRMVVTNFVEFTRKSPMSSGSYTLERIVRNPLADKFISHCHAIHEKYYKCNTKFCKC
jgi:hypothetical protein